MQKKKKNFWCIRTRHPGIARALFQIPKTPICTDMQSEISTNSSAKNDSTIPAFTTSILSPAAVSFVLAHSPTSKR